MRRKSAEARRALRVEAAREWLVDLDPALKAWGEAIRGSARIQELADEAKAEVARTGEAYLAASLALGDMPASPPCMTETMQEAENANIRWRLAMARYAVALDVMTEDERKAHEERR